MKTLRRLFLLWTILNISALYFSGYFSRISKIEVSQGTTTFFTQFYSHADKYFPIQTLNIQYYDLTEFVLYVIIPWLVYLIVRRYTY